MHAHIHTHLCTHTYKTFLKEELKYFLWQRYSIQTGKLSAETKVSLHSCVISFQQLKLENELNRHGKNGTKHTTPSF